MSKFNFSERSLNNLKGVHPDLVKVITRALEISDTDFVVIEGLRTKERQAILVKQGASKTMNSRHITGHAIDIVPFVPERGGIVWDWPYYIKLAAAVKQAANELKIPIRWGGTWTENTNGWETKNLSKTFPDGPHFELPSRVYK